MQINFVAVFALLVILQSLVEGMDEKQRKDCLKLSKRTLKAMMKNFNACNDELGLHKISGEVYQQKIGCVVKCVMKKVEVLDENGMITEATMKKSIESHTPPEYVAYAHEHMMTCVKENKLDPKDENCKSYLDMGTCMQGVLADMCGSAPML